MENNYKQIAEMKKNWVDAIINFYADKAGVDENDFYCVCEYLHDNYFEDAVDWEYIASWLVSDYYEADSEEQKSFFDYNESNLNNLGERMFNCIEG